MNRFNFHRGVLACGRRLPALSLDEALAGAGLPTPPKPTTAGLPATLAALPRSPAKHTILVCPDVKDPTNLGSILRTAAALGAGAAVLGPQCADYLSRRVVRVSMGAALQLPLTETHDVAGCLARLRSQFGYELAAAVVDPAAEPLAKAGRGEKMAIVLGGEAHGLAPDVVALCDRRVTIPMHFGVDSLNVAIAAALFLFHFSQAATD
jgi:tRNA G18 (ribose-2'-O)-methylase SpoU